METPNLQYIQELSGGDTAFEQKLFSILKEEFPVECTFYTTAIQQNELLQAADMVHKLKHKISLLGLEKGHLIATQHENNLREGSKYHHENFLEILTTIDQFLNNFY